MNAPLRAARPEAALAEIALSFHDVLHRAEAPSERHPGPALSAWRARCDDWLRGAPSCELLGRLEALRACALSPEDDEAWSGWRARATAAYDDLARALHGAGVWAPRARPKNTKRNAFHIIGALSALTVVALAVRWFDWSIVIGAAAAAAALAWACEAARRVWPAINARLMRLFGSVAHPHEWHHVNSATWFATALLGLSLTRHAPTIVVALATLGLGDPIAARAGKRWGRHRLANGRSLEGSAAFVGVATAASAAALSLFHAELGAATILIGALAGALAGATAELLARTIDDNIAIPAAAGIAAWCAFALCA